MRTTDDLLLSLTLAVLAVLAALALAGCDQDERPIGVPLVEPAPARLAAEPARADPPITKPAEVLDLRSDWCEPLDPPTCRADADCPGSECVRPWWSASADVRVCSRSTPDQDERRWRTARLAVVVDHVCDGFGDCDPDALLSYLRLLAIRESSLRPWKRHRLTEDLDANDRAWSRHRRKFAGNPAAADPDRWTTGLGLYAQIPALWLPRWDVDAPPEVLCGEVESTEAHLRAARDQVRKIKGGVDCWPVTRATKRIGNRDVEVIKIGDGEPDYWGSACENGMPCRPSWYDASRANSGSVCPGDAEHRRRFEARARDAGLDPWAPVSASALGNSIPRETQDAVAADLRARMESIELPRARQP